MNTALNPQTSPRLPALVVQFSPDDQDAFLGAWLTQSGQPFTLVNTAAGEALPADLTGFGALALLGGTMSAYDDLPALRATDALIKLAIEQDVPVLGHCLGGQLLAQALGATVAPGPQAEIGWQPVSFNSDFLLSRYWFGNVARQTLMHWHYDAFTLPPGAVHLARSAQCACQAFAIGEMHLGMQFHVEVDRTKIEDWLRICAREIRENAHLKSAQSADEIEAGIEDYLSASNALASHIYARWLSRFKTTSTPSQQV